MADNQKRQPEPTQNRTKKPPKIVPKSTPNRSKIDVLYKSGFYLVWRSMFDHFFDNQSNPRTHKMLKNQRVFLTFYTFSKVQLQRNSHSNFHSTWCLFGSKNRPKSDPKPFKINIDFSNNFLFNFLSHLGPILGPNLGHLTQNFRTKIRQPFRRHAS